MAGAALSVHWLLDRYTRELIFYNVVYIQPNTQCSNSHIVLGEKSQIVFAGLKNSVIFNSVYSEPFYDFSYKYGMCTTTAVRSFIGAQESQILFKREILRSCWLIWPNDSKVNISFNFQWQWQNFRPDSQKESTNKYIRYWWTTGIAMAAHCYFRLSVFSLGTISSSSLWSKPLDLPFKFWWYLSLFGDISISGLDVTFPFSVVIDRHCRFKGNLR